ncbi:MAG: glycosyltransferase family 4 protein [Gemmatimonadota bacterium]
MRIALLTFNFWPRRAGIEYVVHDLATELHRAGHQVTVFAPRVRERFDEIEHTYGLVRFGLALPGAFRSGLNRFVLRRIFSSQQRGRPFDVINVHSAYLPASYALDLQRAFGVPVVVTCHGHDIQRDAPTGYGVRLRPRADRIVRRNLRAADRVVAISAAVYEELIPLVAPERIACVPNGVRVDAAGEPSAGVLRRHGVPEGTVILAVGRNHAKKQFDVGLRAFRLLAHEQPDARFVHVGRGGTALAGLAAELGVADRFHALGELDRDEVAAAYREAAIFLLPSAVESFGLVTVEAMAAGLPCVVTDAPGSRDLVAHGTTGLLAPIGDVAALGEALIELARDPARRRALGRAGRQVAVARYGWPAVAQAYVEVYREARAGRREAVPASMGS